MSQVNEIKEAVDIVEIIGERLPLKQAGTNHRALCPFHSESSPSFFVNSQIQRYKCFGCGASGDVLEFLQQYDGMTFLEALQFLADRAGIELKQYARTKDDEEREILLKILQLASKYYHYLLTEHKAGQKARDYLSNRGINQASIKQFKLGYALSQWDGLFNYLTRKKKFYPGLVLKTGLIIQGKTGRYYDRFRDRVVFPLKNHRGQTVGFSGRVLSNDDPQQPKYINTPETQLYHKAKTLFGYSELFQAIRQKKEVVVCEGEFDVIASNQAHVSQIVAIKGSALTADQVKLLERTVEKVILSLDADEPGVKATKRAIEAIKDTSLELRVIDLSAVKMDPLPKDADELIQHDPKLWRETVKESVSAFDFLITVALRKYDQHSASGRRKIIDDLAPVLNNIQHQVEKDFYIKKLAALLEVSVSILADDIKKFGQLKKRPAAKKEQIETSHLSKDSRQHLEDYLLFILFSLPDDQVKKAGQKLAALGLTNPSAQQILKRLSQYQSRYSLKVFSHFLPQDLQAFLMDWSQQPEFMQTVEEINLEKEWRQALIKYQQLTIQDQISKINQQIEALPLKAKKTKAEQTQLDELLRQIVDLQNQRKA